MATEEQGTAPELTEHEQAMVDLVDSKEAASAGSADPENAAEYVEPEVVPDEIDYKAKYEELLSKANEQPEPKQDGLDIKPDAPTDSAKTEDEVSSSLTPEQMNKYSAEFSANGGLSDESYTELKGFGLSKSVVDSYISGQTAIQEARITKVYNTVGGEDAYAEMISWAKESWSPEQINIFNSQVQSGDDAQVMFGVDSLTAQYKANKGSPIPKRTLSGSGNATPNSANKGYANKGEMYKAMRDPQYGKDASYTQAVAKKIEHSQF